MLPIKIAAALVLSVSAMAAEEHDGLVNRNATLSSRDVKIPRALVARIEREYREFLKDNQVVTKEGLRRKLLNVDVELRQEREGALHENVRINTPLGGGVVDLAEFVTPLRGAFHMKIRALEEKGAQDEVPDVRVFFVSHSKARLVDGESFGAGCDKFMEVTSLYRKEMSETGFDLYSTGQRYLSAVGGTFVLIGFDKEALKVGSVTFTDSRHPELLCE